MADLRGSRTVPKRGGEGFLTHAAEKALHAECDRYKAALETLKVRMGIDPDDGWSYTDVQEFWEIVREALEGRPMPDTTIHICRRPPMVERKRQFWAVKWCFRCRDRLPQEAVLMVQDPDDEPNYMGDPYWRVECCGCGEDHVRFPGTEDGPTLEIIDG